MGTGSSRRTVRSAAVGALLLSLSALGAGCGGSPGCDFRGVPDAGAVRLCVEALGVASQGEGFQSGCVGGGALYLPGGCPREGSVGGCKQSSAGFIVGTIAWRYDGTADELRAECRRDRGVYVTP